MIRLSSMFSLAILIAASAAYSAGHLRPPEIPTGFTQTMTSTDDVSGKLYVYDDHLARFDLRDQPLIWLMDFDRGFYYQLAGSTPGISNTPTPVTCTRIAMPVQHGRFYDLSGATYSGTFFLRNGLVDRWDNTILKTVVGQFPVSVYLDSFTKVLQGWFFAAGPITYQLSDFSGERPPKSVFELPETIDPRSCPPAP